MVMFLLMFINFDGMRCGVYTPALSNVFNLELQLKQLPAH